MLVVDFDKLRAIYKFGSELSYSDLSVLISAARLKKHPADTVLIDYGSSKDVVLFILKGLVRSFWTNERGEDITTSLFWENQVMFNADIIFFNEPSKYVYQTLEPTRLLLLPREKLNALVAKSPKLEAHRKLVHNQLLSISAERIHDFVTLSPEERYLKFVYSNPDLVNRVPNKYIAHILGVTPVSLSRIRKRIASKKI